MDTKSDFSDGETILINTSTTKIKLVTACKPGLSVRNSLLMPDVVSILSCSDKSIFNVTKHSKHTLRHFSIALGNTKE